MVEAASIIFSWLALQRQVWLRLKEGFPSLVARTEEYGTEAIFAVVGHDVQQNTWDSGQERRGSGPVVFDGF